MQLLKANTAVDVLIGPFVDSTDGNTAETGLTLSQADIKLSKNGQALTQKTDVTAAAHDSDGYYNCELDATDTNTEGTLVLIVHESGALPVRHEFMVLAEAAYDSLFTAKDTGFMDVNVKAISEDTTAADNLESACDNYSATRGLSGTALPAAAADAAGGLPISDAGGLDLDTYLGRITANVALASVCTEARLAELGAANIPSDIDTLLTRIVGTLAAGTHNAQTGDSFARIGATGSGLTSLAQASVLGALNDAAAAGDPTSADTAMQYIKQLINILIGTAGITTFPAEAAPANAVSLAEVIRAIHADVTGLNGDAMRGTDSAYTGTPPTVAEIRAEMDSNSTQLTAIVGDTNELQTDLTNGGRLDLIFDELTSQGDTNETKLDTIAGYLDTEIAAILTDTGTTLDGKLDDLLEALVYKQIITEANGNVELFNSADVSLGTVAGAITTDGTYTTRLKLVI